MLRVPSMGSGRIHTSVMVGDPGFLLSVCFFFPGGVCVRPSMDWWCVTMIADRLHLATSGVGDEKKNGCSCNLSVNNYELQCEIVNCMTSQCQ